MPFDAPVIRTLLFDMTLGLLPSAGSLADI
jgi:hypothetical protein